MKNSITVAALAALAPVLAQNPGNVGSIAIVNRCNTDLYVWSVLGNNPPSKMFTLPKGVPGVGYREYYRNPRGQPGVSLKIAPYYVGDGQVPSSSLNVTQFEYTLPNEGDPSIYYDLSFVNGDALGGLPFMYTPSSPFGIQCVAHQCEGDLATCPWGYLYPSDDGNTHACPVEQDLVFTMCNNNNGVGFQGPKGQVTVADFAGKNCWNGPCDPNSARKREAEPEPEPEADSAAMAVCADNNGLGIAHFCEEPVAAPAPAPAPSPSPVPSPAPAPKPSTSSSVHVQPSANVALAVASSTAPPPPPKAPVAAAPAPLQVITNVLSNVVGTLSNLQLSSIPDTGVDCWQSVQGSSDGCDKYSHLIGKREVEEKREAHNHHDHMAFHRRNRIQKRA